MPTTRALALAALLSGLLVVGLSGAFLALGMRTVEPLHGAYGDQAMLAFELARTPAELAVVIGRNPPGDDAVAVRRLMDTANRLDFAYMAAYGAFIAFACVLAARARRRPWLALGLLLGPLAALGDVAENLVLLQLTPADADWPALLPSLHARTLFKWELLALASALFAAGFVERGAFARSVAAAALGALALASGALTVVAPEKYLALLSLAIVIAWLWQLGYAIVVLRSTLVKIAP